MKRFGLSLILLLLAAGCAEVITDIFHYGSIEVVAVRRSGEPVPGAVLTLHNDVQVMGRGVTDAQGKYRFDFVPPRPYGVRGEPPDGYARPEDVIGGPSTAVLGPFSIEEGSEETGTFTYVKVGPGSVMVTVREPDGSSVEGTEVFLFGSSGEFAEAVVGGSGTVVFDPVSFGNRGVRVVPPREYLDHDEYEFFQAPLLVEEGWKEEVNFTFEKCLGAIRGRVLDPDGGPIVGFPIRLFGPLADQAMVDTSNEGDWHFPGLECLEFGVALVPTLGWYWEEGPGKSYIGGIKVTRGSDQAFSFTVQRCFADIHVQAEDEAGIPIPDVLVELFTAQGPVVQDRTGTDGGHTFTDVPCGQVYGVKAFPPEGFTLPEGWGSSYFADIRLLPDQGVSLIFTLTRI